MQKVNTGDILLYKTNKHSWFISRLISLFSKTAGEDSRNGHYCHVAMVGWPYQDGTEVLEMTWPRARATMLDLSKLQEHYDIECWRVKSADGNEVCDAVGSAYANLGMKYDWKLVLFGLGNDKHKEVCSTFIYNAWKEAGIDLYPNTPKEKLVSPSELATSPLLERVW